MTDLYADIILPITGSWYTFSIGDKLAGTVKEGCAVAVQFGPTKIVTGIVRRIHSEKPYFKNIKPILELIYVEPVVGEAQIEMWEWVAEYYMCTLGEVMRSAIPAMLKPSGYTTEEFSQDLFRPRTSLFISIGPEAPTKKILHQQLEKLRRRGPKQYETLVSIADKLGDRLLDGEISRTSVNTDKGTLKLLAGKGLITMTERELQPNEHGTTLFPLPRLSIPQRQAYVELRTKLRRKDVALLFGVPSSGKSEICFHAVAKTLQRGRDVLILLPEISLSTQFVRRVREIFGDRVTLYHSALTDRRRAEAYLNIMNSGGGSLVVGVRSSIFLPFKNLGLVVVDEEQDAAYKQQDPAPRYNARDTAIVLARMHKAKVILSSATPSLETWSNASRGKYGLVTLTERYGDAAAPMVILSDTIRSVKRGERTSHFNKELFDRIKSALAGGEQVILFQNRRGLAPYLECTDCGHVPRCSHCGIPMTVHRTLLRCHYCGAASHQPSVCPKCGGMNLVARGFGTEKIEEELGRLIPGTHVLRLDRDSAGSERAYTRIITDFENREADILVGTQMVTKGLDFAGVSLVGILNADNLLNHPDFRASERAYQLIAQVAGRSGRRNNQGTVVIQTADPGNRIINQAAQGDYGGMAADILPERATYGYPPYCRLVSVMLRNRDRDALYAAARRFEELMRPTFKERLLGPQPPATEKIKSCYALMFLIKVPRKMPMAQVRERLRKAIINLRVDIVLKKTIITLNVDPQ